MADDLTNCAQIRERMLDAVTDSLSGNLRPRFDAHLGHCAACEGEFRKMQTLLQAIDRTLSVSLTVEPSARLVANVRENICQNGSLQPHRIEVWRRWWTWAAAAGVCATFAILLFVVRTSRRLNPQLHDSATVRTNAPPILKPAVHPRLNASTETAGSRPRRSMLAFARHTSPRPSNEITGEPEVIVQPGQMQAILQLVAATQTGKVNGADLFASQKNAAELFKIKPLVIAPLKISALEDEAEPSTSNVGLDSGKSSLSSRSN